jgi:hypothetical protein
MVELYRRAFDGLAAPFSEFLGTACADWVIVDVFHHWAAAAALEHKVAPSPTNSSIFALTLIT